MRTSQLCALADRIAAITERDRPRGGEVQATWGPTLSLGVAHEWFADTFPPLLLLIDLAAAALAARHHDGLVMWIGRRCWPNGATLARRSGLLDASVMVDPPSEDARLWLTDVAARSPSVSAVIADAQGLRTTATRRIQLAAGSGGGLCLLVRPLAEMRLLSACASRWVVTPERSVNLRPRWSVALVRDKTRPAMTDRSPRWLVEWCHETGAFVVDPRVGGAARHAARSRQRRAIA